MKKTIVLAIASCSVAPVFAQSSVTMYGVADVGVVHISDNATGDSVTQMRSGNVLTSRLGFRGQEDLGGGMKALFNFESTVNLANGAASTPFFNRQSWAGFSSDRWGQLTMGRQLPSISDLLVQSSPALYFGAVAAGLEGAGAPAGSSSARFNNMIGGARIDSAFKYRSPDMSGFKLYAMTVLKGDAGGSTFSAGLGYNNRAIDAGLIVQTTNCGDSGGCAVGKDKDQIIGLGGAYKVNGNRFGLNYTRQENAKNIKGNDADVLTVLARIPVDQWTFTAGYQFLNDRTIFNQDTQQLNLGISYNLSKRTSLYTIYALQNVKSGGKAGMFGVLSSSDKQSQISAGITHSF